MIRQRSESIPEEVRLLAVRHPLSVLGHALYVIGTAAAGVGAVLICDAMIWGSQNVGAAGTATVVAAVVMGFHSRSLREKAVAAALLEVDREQTRPTPF